MKKYVLSFTRYLLFYALGFLVFFITGYFIRAFHELLCQWFPTVFTAYDPIYDRENYERQSELLGLIEALISLYTLTHLAAVYDNERFEYMIGKTDGFYTLKEGLAVFIPRYIAVDLFTALGVPALFSTLSLLSAPKGSPEWVLRIIDLTEPLLSIQNAFTDFFGAVGGIAVLLFSSALFRIPAAYFAVKRFRGVWLSDTEG